MTSEVMRRHRMRALFYLRRHRPRSRPRSCFSAGSLHPPNRDLTMDAQELVERYVAVWNEADPAVRRDRIRSLWAPDGTTCHRLLEARGHAAIEARVTGSW